MLISPVAVVSLNLVNPTATYTSECIPESAEFSSLCCLQKNRILLNQSRLILMNVLHQLCELFTSRVCKLSLGRAHGMSNERE